jgi:hypothetical protein
MKAVTEKSVHPVGRDHKLVGEHDARCKREKHEDWQHGLTGCAVGTESNHCACKAYWVEVAPATRFGQ